MEILLSIFYALLFVFLILKMKFFVADGLSKKIIAGIFLLKIFSGVALWAIYTYYYIDRSTSDIFRFFDDAVRICNATHGNFQHYLQIVFGINSEAGYLQHYFAETDTWFREYDYGLFNDDRTIIRFNAFTLIFSFGYYQVHSLFMNFLSLVGLVALYKTFAGILPERKTELLFAVFLIPTVLFWGSGVLKEGLILFALGIFIYNFSDIFNNKISAGNFSFAILSLFLLTIIKMYVLLCFLPAIISLLVIKFTSKKMFVLKFASIHLLLIILALNIHYVFPEYNILEMLQIKQRDFYNTAELREAGSAIDIGRLEPNARSFIKHTPQALFSVFFRPHFLEANSSFLFVSAAENFVLISFIIFYLFHFKKPGKEDIPWFLLCLSFVIFLALLIGWTTPILGAVVRYKLPLLPFLIFIFLFLSVKPSLIIKIEKWLKRS